MKNKFSRKSLLLVSMTVVLATVINLFAGVVAFADDATTTDVIEIESDEELAKIGVDANYPLNGNYKLTADIDISDSEWTPIGDFAGTFDGNGKTISGMTFTQATDAGSVVGLFKIVNGTVKNLKMTNVNITLPGSVKDVGVIAHQLGDNATISACETSGTITMTSAANTTRTRWGGITSYAGSNSVIEYCKTNVIIEANSNAATSGDKLYKNSCYIAGIVAQSLGNIKYCVNKSKITVIAESGAAYAGGICGTNVTWGGNVVTVQNCVNNGDVSVKYPPVNNQNTSEIGAGGILGYISSDKTATLKNNFNFGTVTSDRYAGQILGYYATTPTASENYGITGNGKLVGKDEADNSNWGTTDTKENMLSNQPTLGTQVVGYQTSEAKESKFNLRLVATMEGGYANLTNVGFTVSASYGDVTKDEQIFTMETLYGSISAEANTKAEKEYTAEELGGDYIFVLACKNLPQNVGYITFTVTTFYTDANGTHSNMVQTFKVDSNDIPSADMPEVAA